MNMVGSFIVDSDTVARTRSPLKTAGFTIVELLVVIVVIAILAAIAVVSYNGVITNARNTSRVDAASTVRNSLKLYHAGTSTQQLRSLFVGLDQCIGRAYEDVDPGAGTSCRYVEYSSPATQVSTPVNDALYNAISSVAQYSTNYSPVEQRNFSNVIKVASSAPFLYHQSSALIPGRTWQVDSGQTLTNLTFISYRLEGENQDCKLQPILQQGPLAGGVVQHYTTGHKNSASNGGATECWLWLDFLE